jgi:hypothetical protein
MIIANHWWKFILHHELGKLVALREDVNNLPAIDRDASHLFLTDGKQQASFNISI